MIKNSIASGDGAFLEFKKYGNINLDEINLSDCSNPSGYGSLHIGYNIKINISNSHFSNTITARGTIKLINDNEMTMKNCSFFNVTGQYGGHLRVG